MRNFSLMTAALCLIAAPALADDDELGAYLYQGDCTQFDASTVIKDLGDLEIEDDAQKEWARLSPDGAEMPDLLWVEDESTRSVSAEDLAAGGHAIAVTADDDPRAAVIACGEIPADLVLPHAGDLLEVNDSGMIGRFAIEARRKGVKFTTAAFQKPEAPTLD